MSRKKALRGKAAASSPCAGSPAGKGTGRAARSSPGIVQMNGVVHPSRPAVSSSSEFYDIAFKVMLVGDSGVGKTCLLVRFKDGAFLAGSFISTVGIDFRIWDTAGQERFRSVTHAYYRDAHALLLLYDVTNRTSFDNIQAWLTEIHEYAQQDVVLMLLGNKADATHDRVVKREDGERLAKEFGVPFMETSARSGLNVELAFTAVAKELKHRSMKDPSEKFKLHEYVNKEMKGVGCCRS
ncbi:ras-related protein Rab-26-like isoform X2 [Cololabis saira]|uniref:ras-related protein Rab-26-like isoform X2 n=1 Tax=Cololabis saira TaxID=129043 RepID=UPI002AD28837|nr:ras-related protein Rab-26-like isoform X2 [Cololabis saira]